MAGPTYISVYTYNVQTACSNYLARIKRARASDRREYIMGNLNRLLERYDKAWFKFLLHKPTIWNAVREYRKGDYFCQQDIVRRSYINDEQECLEVFKAAQASDKSRIWLSSDSCIIPWLNSIKKEKNEN